MKHERAKRQLKEKHTNAQAGKPEAKIPAKAKHPDTLTIYEKPGDDPDATLAQAYLRPTVQAGCTVRAYNKGKDGSGPSLDPLIAELQTQVSLVDKGDLRRAEAMLMAQAHSLDAIFGNLARRAARNAGEYLGACDTFLRLALKAQSQCRATLETLATIKNPPTIFAKQANVTTGPQQVNNGLPALSRARETENLQSKLLEAHDGERLDASTANAASNTDSVLAPVGKVNGTEDAYRKG